MFLEFESLYIIGVEKQHRTTMDKVIFRWRFRMASRWNAFRTGVRSFTMKAGCVRTTTSLAVRTHEDKTCSRRRLNDVAVLFYLACKHIRTLFRKTYVLWNIRPWLPEKVITIRVLSDNHFLRERIMNVALCWSFHCYEFHIRLHIFLNTLGNCKKKYHYRLFDVWWNTWNANCAIIWYLYDLRMIDCASSPRLFYNIPQTKMLRKVPVGNRKPVGFSVSTILAAFPAILYCHAGSPFLLRVAWLPWRSFASLGTLNEPQRRAGTLVWRMILVWEWYACADIRRISLELC